MKMKILVCMQQDMTNNFKLEWIMRAVKLTLLFLASTVIASCGTVGNTVGDGLNVFSDPGPDGLGERSTSAINGGKKDKVDEARHSLEVIGAYQRALPPQPYYPVVKPAEIRLMWIPDHVNKLGDLVPAHYYYLRILNDTWAVTDAFENERILSANPPGANGGGGAVTPQRVGNSDFGTGSAGGSSTPWQYQSK